MPLASHLCSVAPSIPAAAAARRLEKPATRCSTHYGWRLERTLRYLRHFYEASGGRLHEDDARAIAVQVGYDPRGVAGFYQGTASLRREGPYRVLTDAGRQFYEEHRHRLD